MKNFNLKEKIKNFNIKNCRVDFEESMEKLQYNGKALFLTVLFALVFMFLVCLTVFFMTVKGAEKVLVPNVEGKELTSALIEMQQKELYPKIQLRYTDNPEDAGKILNQSPDAGAIVKAGTRVSLTVSRGVIIDHVENYVGLNYDDVKIKLQTLFSGSGKQLILLASPVYKADQSEAGTILEQDPPEGTSISDPVTVQLIVSRGPAYDSTKVPDLTEKSISDVLAEMANTKLVFDFTSHAAAANEIPGTVTSIQKFSSEFVNNYTHVIVDLALPTKASGDTRYGIFTREVAKYPYAVTMTLKAVPEEGQPYTLVTIDHTGGKVTIPYAVQKGTELIFSVAGKEVARETVR